MTILWCTQTLWCSQALASQVLRGKSFGVMSDHQDHQGRKELIVDQSLFEARPKTLTAEDIQAYIPAKYYYFNHPIMLRSRMMEQTGNPAMQEVRDGNFLRDGIGGKAHESIMNTTNDDNFIRGRIMTQTGIALMNRKQTQKIIRAQMDSSIIETAQDIGKTLQIDDSEDQDERAPSSKNIPGEGKEESNQPKSFNAVNERIQHKFDYGFKALKAQAIVTYEGLFDSRLEYRADQDILRFSIEEKFSENSRFALTHQKDRFEERQSISYEFSW